MPKYKLPNGKIVTIEDIHVEAFLESKDGEGAVLVQEGPIPVEQKVETPGINFDDYLKPVKIQDSASADPTVESVDMGSKSVDTSSESQSTKPNRYLKFKGDKIVYEDEYLSKYAGKDGLPASFDDYAKMWKTKPLTFDSPEITVESKKTEELIPSLKNAWKKREYNKDTEMYEPSFNDVLLNLDEEEAVEMFRGAYKGSGIEFEQANQIFDKKQGKELDSEVLFTDAVRMKILDKETGEYIYSKPIELQRGEEFNDRNESIINDFIESNKDKIDASKWVRTQNKQLVELEKWQEQNFKPELKQKEVQLKQEFLDNPNLFDAVDEQVLDITNSNAYTFGGGVSVPTTKTIKTYPYEKEIKQKVSILSKKYPNKTKEEIEDLAKEAIRSDLYESARLDFIYAKNEEYLSNSSSVKKTQGLLYSTLLNKVNKEADKFNESSKKIQLSQDSFYQAEKDLNKVAEYYRVPDVDKNKEVGELFAKYNVDMVDSPEVTVDDEFNKKYRFGKGSQIPTNFYNIINRISSSAEADKNIISAEASKMDDAIDMMTDNSTIAEAASKNYDLLEKYAMNTAIGTQDIIVGTAFLTGNILTLGQSDALKKKGVEYTEYTNRLRDSYVRDVSFDDAFTSAENTGKFIAQEISNQIPILVAMAASGGLGGLTAGVSSAGKQMMDMQHEIATGRAQYSDIEIWLKSTGFGVAEGVFSQLTTVRALGRAKARWVSSGREQVLNNSTKEYFKSKAPTLIYEPLLEAGGEALTTGTQNLITGRDFISDMDHSAVSGFGFGLLFAGIPFMKGMYNSRFSTYESLNEVRQAQRELVDLERRFQTSQSSADSNSNKLLVDLINRKREKINDLVTSREKLINNNLTSGGASNIIRLVEMQLDLQNKFEDVNNNTDIDQDTKDQLLAEIKQEFDAVTRAKEKALSSDALKANETEWDAFKALNRSKAETYMSEAESILKDERDGRDVQRADVNRKAYDLYYGDLVRTENEKLGKSALFKSFKVFETVQDAVNYVESRDKLSDKERKTIIANIKNGNDGYADPNTGETVAIVENQVRNQRRYTKVHEIGHQVFWKLLGKDNNSKAMKGIASQLLSTMKSVDKKLYEKFINDGIDDQYGNIIPAEVISRFLEYVSENKITNVQKAKGIAGLFGVMVQKEFSKDYNFNFRGENDIFNFVVGIGNKIKSGELSTDDIGNAIDSGIVGVASKKGENTDFVDTEGNAVSFSKSVEQIQKEIIALEEQYDEQTIDYYDFENRMDILEAELEKAKTAPKEAKVKPVKKSTQLSIQDIKDQIEQLDEDLYSGVIDDIDYEQKLDLLEERLKQAELRVTNPKKAQENQDKIVKQSVDKFKKDVSEETVSDKNKNIAKINEDIANEMLELGANQVSEIEDPIKRKQIIDKLGKNNLGAVTNLTKRAAAAGKNLAIDDNLKIGYDEFFSGFSEELSALIRSYKVEVDGKRVPFGAYMNKNLPLRYGQILDNALKGRIEGSKSLDVQAGEKGYAGSIIADRAADFDATTSAEMGLPVDDLIDVTTFRKVKDKVEAIKESIDLTGVDLDGLTYRKIQDDYSGQVGAELIGMWDRNAEPNPDQDRNDFQKLAERIEGTRTLNYGKDTGGEAEVRAMQGLFLDYNDAVKFIKTMPEFNVAPFETTIDEQGKSIDLTEDARGYSTGISNKLLKEFYEPYIDPKSKSSNKDVKSRSITSPSGRGKGKTSQVAKVYRLKPEYRGKISRQTVQGLQKKIGITPAGEAFIPMKGKNRTEFGTALQGLTKMYATNVANTIIRKKIVEEGLSSERKTPEKLLADIGGGKSSIMFSRATSLGLNAPFETSQLGEVLFSKKARADYESVLRKRRPDLENPGQQVDELIKWGNNLEGVPDNKKAKYKKLGLYYMANGFVIMPEDGYKIVEAIRLGEANKVDPYTVKNPNELIEKYQAKTKGVRINPDKVKEFSNKKVLAEGVTVYDVDFSKEGQLAVRKAVDTNWGYKADPWCLVARQKQEQRSEYDFFSTKEQAQAKKKSFEATGEFEAVNIEDFEYNLGDGNTETRFVVQAVRPLEKNYDELGAAYGMWGGYNKQGGGFKIAFQDNKLLAFRDGNKLEWWDRQDKPSNKIKLKDKKISENIVSETFVDPTTGEVEVISTDTSFGEASMLFSRVTDLGLNTPTETMQLGEVLFSKKARTDFENILRSKRPDLENPSKQVDELIKWGDALNVKENKKAKYKKLALYYMANGQVIMPEDGYKVVEAIRLSDINKIDPYSFKNPNVLIEKYQDKTKAPKIDPDKVKQFSNKKVLADGVTVYDVDTSKEGQLAVRKVVDSNWGYKANPWCLIARSDGGDYVETDEAGSRKEAEEMIADYKEAGYHAEIQGTYMHNGKKIFEIEVSEIDKDPNKLTTAFGMWNSYNEKGKGFKIAFQNNKLLSFRDGDNLEWWDKQDVPSKKIKLKDKRLSSESVVEEFINPETGKKEIGKTIKTYTEDGNANVKEVYDVNGNLEEKTYTQEVEEDIFLSINEKFSAEEYEKVVKVDNTANDTKKTVSKFVDKRTGETKININVVGKKYHEYTRQVEKDGVVRTEIETIRSYDDNKTIYNAEIYKGELKVDVDKLEGTDFESYTDLDGWFENENQKEATILFSNGIEDLTNEMYQGINYKLKVNGTEKQYLSSLERILKVYKWLMENTVIPALPASHYINQYTTETDKSKFGTDQGRLEWNRRDNGKREFRKFDKTINKGKFTSMSPPKLYGREKTEIESNLLSGNIAKFNKENGKRWELIWTEIFRAARQNKKTIPLLSSLVKTSSYKTNHWHRLGAEFVGIEKGVELDEVLQRYYDYEHALQANQAAYVLWREVLTLAYDESISYQEAEAIFKDKLEEVRENYKLIALGVESHKRVNKFYGKKMPEGWKGWNERYFNALVASIDGGINPDNIVFFNEEQNGWGKTAREVFNVNADGTTFNSLFSKGRLDAEFNKIIENKTGILATDEISEVKAKMIANNKRRFNIFIPPSAEDFVGLLYATLGKGSIGEKQMMFYDRTLIRPYARAMQAITRDRIDLGRSFKKIRSQFNATPKDLKQKLPNSLFTKEQAVRIYIWDSIGKEVPGLNVDEVNELANYVADNKQLKDFADQVMRLNPGSTYASPDQAWTTGTITTDLLSTLNESRRAKHLGRWKQNVDEIFSNANLNKLEAAYGTSYRRAMENMLARMETGRNKTISSKSNADGKKSFQEYGSDSQTAKWIDWVNGSVGAIMFLNARSAVLQTISAANFINFGDNNVFAAGKAFANQKQYWSDFAYLMNSDYLVERRDSLKININEADIAEAAQKKGARGAINYLLKLGFTPTKFADSFAIASGGASFYRNRLNALIKKGMDPVAAEKAAMRDFIEKSEESQQSSRPDKISQEQAGPLGRVILAFANTPAQYARIIKKAALDLKNRRGSDRENISKIIYYGVAQNLLFNALQQAIFAVAFGDEEEDDELLEKELNIVNGMLDGIIRGTGVGGAIFTIVKNSGLRIYKESNKDRPNYEKVVDEVLKISPPISSKVSKLKSAARTFTWDAKEIKGKGLDITNPAVGATAKIISAGTNLPLDRVVRKIENLKAASDSELETYKRIALTLGWGKWELGIKDKKWKDPNKKPKSKSRVIRRKAIQREVIRR